MDLGTISIIAIGVLCLIFVIGTVFPINIGLMGFIAAFIVGNVVCGLDVDKIFDSFPASLFIILVGVTFFFNILKENGTIDLIAHAGLRLVRGNVGLIPWVMFVLATLLSSVGTQGTVVIIIVAPIAMRLADQCKINQLMMALMVAFGMLGGFYSPISLMGLVVREMIEKESLPFSPVTLYLGTMLFCTGLGVISFVLFGGIKLLRQNKAREKGAADDSAAAELLNAEIKITPYKIFSLLGLAVLIWLGLGVGLNMGFAGLMIGFVLGLFEPKKQNDIIKSIPWGIIFMLSGIVTYVGVMQELGVMDYLATLIADFNNPQVAALITFYIGGFVSAFVSTTGFLAGLIPLIIPLMKDPTLWAMGLITGVCVSATVVDICPFSTTGAVLVANAQGEEKNTFYKKLLNTSIVVILVAPLLAWLIFIALT